MSLVVISDYSQIMGSNPSYGTSASLMSYWHLLDQTVLPPRTLKKGTLLTYLLYAKNKYV